MIGSDKETINKVALDHPIFKDEANQNEPLFKEALTKIKFWLNNPVLEGWQPPSIFTILMETIFDGNTDIEDI